MVVVSPHINGNPNKGKGVGAEVENEAFWHWHHWQTVILLEKAGLQDSMHTRLEAGALEFPVAEGDLGL